MNIRPMKPYDLDESELASLRYPLVITPKINGIRGLVVAGIMQSASGKALPNKSLQKWTEENAKLLEGRDGEIIVGKIGDPDLWNKSSSFCMSRDQISEFRYIVFDSWRMGGTYANRLEELTIPQTLPPNAFPIPWTLVTTAEEALARTKDYVLHGYEGSVLRSPKGVYKYGRSTLKEHGMLKLKFFKDSEAVVLSYKELMHNENGQELSELGLAKRSSSQEGKIGGGMLGALIVQDLKTNAQFDIGTGFDRSDRIRMWKDRDNLIGKTVKYKFFDFHVKTMRPVNPVFEGFRDLNYDC